MDLRPRKDWSWHNWSDFQGKKADVERPHGPVISFRGDEGTEVVVDSRLYVVLLV
ncbi:MAG TPA: hypothetical protein VMU99_00035 [Acidimicrobiales bacterium]|nr:hypothetical protein [Acidimicrobiales bacterium]